MFDFGEFVGFFVASQSCQPSPGFEVTNRKDTVDQPFFEAYLRLLDEVAQEKNEVRKQFLDSNLHYDPEQSMSELISIFPDFLKSKCADPFIKSTPKILSPSPTTILGAKLVVPLPIAASPRCAALIPLDARYRQDTGQLIDTAQGQVGLNVAW